MYSLKQHMGPGAACGISELPSHAEEESVTDRSSNHPLKPAMRRKAYKVSWHAADWVAASVLTPWRPGSQRRRKRQTQGKVSWTWPSTLSSSWLHQDRGLYRSKPSCNNRPMMKNYPFKVKGGGGKCINKFKPLRGTLICLSSDFFYVADKLAALGKKNSRRVFYL